MPFRHCYRVSNQTRMTNPKTMSKLKTKRNSRAISACLWLAAALSIQPVFAVDYFVDSIAGSDTNPGTSAAAPWKTISKVNGITFLPGDQVLFKRGSVFAGRLTPKGSGNATSQLIFGAYGTGSKPVIDGSGNAQAIHLQDNTHITIQDFEIINNGTTSSLRDGIRIQSNRWIQYLDDIRILNNDIHTVAGRSQRDYGLYHNAAIYIVAADHLSTHVNPVRGKFRRLTIEGNHIHDIKCSGIYFKPANYYDIGGTTYWATDMVVRDNVFDRTGGDHVVLAGAINPLVEYNAGYDAGINGANYGWIAGMWVWKTDGATFQHNEVARTQNERAGANDGDGQAFDVDISTFGDYVFQYNYTHDNVGGILLMMYTEGMGKTIKYRYNLSVNDGRDTYGGVQIKLNLIAGLSTANIYNNVFFSNRTEGFTFTDVSLSSYNNNIFDVPVGLYPSKPRLSNNCYNGHIANVNDPYKVLGDPRFVGPLPAGITSPDGFTPANVNVFKLQPNSPCINKGMNIADNGGVDFYGNPLYSGGRADIGIHEVPGTTAPAPADLTFIDNTDPAIVYNGTWAHGEEAPYHLGTKSSTSTVWNYMEYSFTGTNISLFGKKNPSNGRMLVSIDGGPAVTVDAYWPTDLFRQHFHTFTGLSNGPHTIRATLTTKNPLSAGPAVAIDYLLISPGTPPAAPDVTNVDSVASSAVTYNGTWTHTTTEANSYGKTHSSSSTLGSYVEFAFTGTGAKVYGGRHQTFGKLEISVDGVVREVVDTYNATNIDHLAPLFEIGGLPSGSHVLRATVVAKNPESLGNNTRIDLFQALNGPSGPITFDDTASPALVYTGTWSQGSAMPEYHNTTRTASKVINDVMEFTFTGSSVSLFSKKAANMGNVEISIDGGTPSTVNMYNSTMIPHFLVKKFSGLPYGTHTVKAKILPKSGAASDNYFVVDYFIINPDGP